MYDFGRDYIAFPKANVPFAFTCNCDNCGYEWPVVLRLTVRLALESERIEP